MMFVALAALGGCGPGDDPKGTGGSGTSSDGGGGSGDSGGGGNDGGGGSGGDDSCATAADCPAPETVCQVATCDSGTCNTQPAPAGAGAPCDDGGGNVCNADGQCVPAHCGDGILDPGEGCDDGNTAANDCCSAACQVEPSCTKEGEPNNACEQANGPVTPDGVFAGTLDGAGDKDTFSFTVPVVADVQIKLCGMVSPLDNLSVTLYDSASCINQKAHATAGMDGCATLDPAIDAGLRQLVPGTYHVAIAAMNPNLVTAYTATVTLTSQCGNGMPEPFEGCDDGNLTGGDGCSASCAAELGYTCTGAPSACLMTCGDGGIDPGNECDDANLTDGDGCSSSCQIEPGYLCAGEPSLCAPSCGDGVVNGLDECDDGNGQNGDGCDDNCTVTSCGNGVVADGETCDDGNTLSGDCCSATCQVEPSCTKESEPNNACDQANGPLTPDGIFVGTLAGAGDRDTLSFTVPVVANVALQLCGMASPADLLSMALYDSVSCISQKAYAAVGMSGCATLDPASDPGLRQLAPGTYHVAIGAMSPDLITAYGVTVALTSQCGNGVAEPFEGCDDGNLTGGDGCSASCTVE